METRFRKPLATLLKGPATISILLVRLYQATLSPDHGPLRHLYPYGFCRHSPTCSEYAIHTLRSEPYFKALALITRRIISCNPWTKPSDERLREAVQKGLI